jgi:hypothetical protein
MIVNSLNDGWEIIYQRSHASLSAILLSGWRKADRPLRFTEVILAAAQHDDQEMFFKQSQVLNALGAPLDFLQTEMDTQRIQAEAVIDNAFRQSMWIALLISHHNSYLYESQRGDHATLDAFLDQQRENQRAWTKALKLKKAQVMAAYSLLNFADRMSLTLCRHELPDQGRFLDVGKTPDGEVIRVSERDDGTLAITPWIFEDSHFDVSAEARKLRDLHFANDEAFLTALHNAEIETLTWTFTR